MMININFEVDNLPQYINITTYPTGSIHELRIGGGEDKNIIEEVHMICEETMLEVGKGLRRGRNEVDTKYSTCRNHK